MKTTLPILLLFLLASCSQTPPAKKQAHFTEPVVAQTNAPVVTEAVPATEPPAPVPTPDTSVQLRETPAIMPAATNHEAVVAAGEPAPAPHAATPGRPTRPNSTPAPGAAANPRIAARTGAVTAPAPAATADAAASDIIPPGMIDFRNTPLDQVLQVYAELVNRTLLRPAALPQPQITLKTQTQLTKAEAIQALDAVLGLNGITTINVGEKFMKVVAQPQAVQEGAANDNRNADELPEFGGFVTHVVQLKYVKPSEIVPALQPFAKMNSILPIDATQILIIRDYTENVKRMLEMIDKVDITVPAEFISEVIPIKYAKASEIADALNSLSGGGGGGTSIGRSSSTGTRTGGGGLGNMGSGANRLGVGGTGGYNSGVSGMGTTTPLGGGAGASGGSFSDRLQQIVRKAATSGDLEILGKTKMIADERSNSLLIFATRSDMEMIKNVVAKLDVVLSQVLIETVIMDVQIGNTLAYGVTAGQPPKTNSNGSAIGGIYNNSTGPLGTLGDFFGSNLTNGTTFPTGNNGLTYFGRYKGELSVVLQAASTDSRINVIQKPRILTSHATPGSIFVGNTVPYVTSTYYGGGYSGPSSSYQQLQVGIGLQVTPYINPDGLVVMQIDETIDELAGTTAITGVGDVPNTTSRKLSAEVAVRDGDTILLGGFIRNSTTKSASGVPLLKDIPILGALFSGRSDAKERKELMVLMRPTVLKTPEMAATTTLQEKQRLPGISAAEAEVQDQEKAELDQERKRQEARARAAAKAAEKEAKRNATAH